MVTYADPQIQWNQQRWPSSAAEGAGVPAISITIKMTPTMPEHHSLPHWTMVNDTRQTTRNPHRGEQGVSSSGGQNTWSGDGDLHPDPLTLRRE
jgi:hypothetical protein